MKKNEPEKQLLDEGKVTGCSKHTHQLIKKIMRFMRKHEIEFEIKDYVIWYGVPSSAVFFVKEKNNKLYDCIHEISHHDFLKNLRKLFNINPGEN